MNTRALKGETVPDSLPATPKSPPTRRVPPRGTPRVAAPLPLSPFSPPDRDRTLGLIPGSGRSPGEGIGYPLLYSWPSVVAQLVKNPPVNAGDIRDVGSIPGLGRSPGGGHGNPLQRSCPENPMDRGAWWATVHGVAESQTPMSPHTALS